MCHRLVVLRRMHAACLVFSTGKTQPLSVMHGSSSKPQATHLAA